MGCLVRASVKIPKIITVLFWFSAVPPPDQITNSSFHSPSNKRGIDRREYHGVEWINLALGNGQPWCVIKT